MDQTPASIGIVGTGFVADLYMRSLQTFPHIRIVGAFDIDGGRLAAFASYWKLRAAASLDDLLAHDHPDLILNLTNPGAHFEVSQACLQAGHHVYSEKPLAMAMDDARRLHALAQATGLMLASAPCSLLGEAAQTLWAGVRRRDAGRVRLVYAELDDDYIPAAPYRKWASESGAPWPYRDEFEVGCTVEHAGYYLSWLIAMFGSVTKVAAASANVLPDKLADAAPTTPDYSCATLFFESGVVARLTCSIVAPHDHRLRVIGDQGVLELDECWANGAPVRLRRRHVFRRRLFNSPWARRVAAGQATDPKVGRRGAASMNFALGPAEMLAALREKRASRLNADFALHMNEVTLAIQNAGDAAGVQVMTTRCPPIAPMDWTLAAAPAESPGESRS
jgi:predicted dehydrogenase